MTPQDARRPRTPQPPAPAAEPGTDDRPPPQDAHSPEAPARFLSIIEAARQTGASASAIRNYVNGEHVRTRQGTGPRGPRQEVAVQDVLDRMQQTGATPTPAAPGTALSLADAFARLENMAGQLTERGERAARAEVRAEMLAAQANDLRTALEDTRAALADARAENERLRAETDQQHTAQAGQQQRRSLFGRRRPES